MVIDMKDFIFRAIRGLFLSCLYLGISFLLFYLNSCFHWAESMPIWIIIMGVLCFFHGIYFGEELGKLDFWVPIIAILSFVFLFYCSMRNAIKPIAVYYIFNTEICFYFLIASFFRKDD